MTPYKYYEKSSFAFLSILEKNCQPPIKTEMDHRLGKKKRKSVETQLKCK